LQTIITIAVPDQAQIVAYVVSKAIYNLYFHPLRDYPGPNLRAVTRLPHAYWQFKGKYVPATLKLHEKYGPIVRVAPNELSYTHPDAWKTIYGNQPAGTEPFIKNPKIYNVAANGVAAIIAANEQDHHRIRKALSPAFSEKSIQEESYIMQGYVDLLVDRLHKLCKQGDPVDLVQWYNFTTFDIIGDLAFGEPFGCLEQGKYHPWVATIFGGFKFSALGSIFKSFPPADRIVDYLLPKELKKKRLAHFQQTVEKVGRRLENGNNRPDFITKIETIARPELDANSALLIFAGSETTATLLSGLSYLLAQNPDVKEKLIKELREKISFVSDMSLPTLSQLQYMSATLTEALRIYPPVAEGLARIVPSGGRIICGKYVPEGVSIKGYNLRKAFC
jgi:cytochrome P450